MNRLRKPLLGLMAALIALFATMILTGGADGEGGRAVAERTAPGPSA